MHNVQPVPKWLKSQLYTTAYSMIKKLQPNEGLQRRQSFIKSDRMSLQSHYKGALPND